MCEETDKIKEPFTKERFTKVTSIILGPWDIKERKMCKDCQSCEKNNQALGMCNAIGRENSLYECCPWPSKRVEKKIDISIEIINLKAMADSFCMTAYEKETTRKMAIKGKKLLDSIISKCL